MKRIKLDAWQLAIIEEAMRSYHPPGFTEIATKQYAELVELMAKAKTVNIQINS